MNDLIQLACWYAVRKYGGSDGMFCAAGFGTALASIAGLRCKSIDGNLVRAILCGRPQIEMLSGGSYFRLILAGPKAL